MSVYVNVDELRGVANDLKTRKQAISDIYESKIKPALTSSEEAIVASGINFNDFIKTFNTIFNNLDGRLDNLVNVLNNKIIPNYDQLGSSIASSFNNDFASQMSNILGSNN